MSTHAFLVFASKADADAILFEIAATPAIETGTGPVWVWFNPDNPDLNTVTYAAAADGRVAMAHPWSEPDREWFSIYCDEWIADGKMQVLDAMPEDWKPAEPPVGGEAVYGEITFTPIIEGEATSGEITFTQA